MAQLATDKWLNRRYGVCCKEYPIYRTIRFSNVSNGPATGNIYYCISGHSNSGYVGNTNYTVCYVNPIFTWTNRIIYSGELYDVYKITGSDDIIVPSAWNSSNTNGIEALFSKGWPLFGTIYIRASIAEDYKAPYDDGSNSYYYINDKTNIRVNMTAGIVGGTPDIMVPNLFNLYVAATGVTVSGIRSSYANSPEYGRDIFYNFGTVSTVVFGKTTSDVTLYYKCSVKLNSKTNNNLTAVYIYQDESSILNVDRSGISRNNYEFNASIGGDKIGQLQPSNVGDKGVVICNNSNNISSLESSFNCIDTSLTSNISLTTDYFERKVYELRHIPIIGYAAASSSKGIRGNFGGNTSRQSIYFPQTSFQYNTTATMGGNIKIFPPTISGLDILLGNTTQVNFNRIIQFPYFYDSSYKPTTEQIDSQTSNFILYGKPSGYDELHVNNVLFSTNNSVANYICNDPNHTNVGGGFIQTLTASTLSFCFVTPLSGYSNAFEGFTYGVSSYYYNFGKGQSISPICIGYLSSYISPGLDITSNALVEIDKDIDHTPEWTEDSNNISGTVVNDYLCDIYYSDYSTGVNNGEARMTITISGLQTFSCYIRAWTESASYDYVVISELNETCTRTSYKTKGVNSDTEWTLVEYEDLGGETYTIEVLYTKDGSVNRNDDCGYIAIPRGQGQEQINLSTNYLPYKTIDYLTKEDADKIYYHPTLYNIKLSSAYTFGYITNNITNVNGYASIPVVTVPSSICPGATSITTSSANITISRLSNSSIRLSVTLPTTLGPFKLRNFAYHTTASNNPFLTHSNISTSNIKKITNKITTQLGITGAITATQLVSYTTPSGLKTSGYAGILDIGRHYTATCISTSGDITLRFVRKRTTATCTVSFGNKNSATRGSQNGYLKLETLHLPELLVDSTCTRTTVLTTDAKLNLAY